MKKFTTYLSLFLFFSATFYVAALIFWGEYSPIKKNLRYRIEPSGHTFSRLKEVRSKGNVDLLFLGSSHTYRGFDVRYFEKEGYSCFNLGSNSQTPIQTEYLLNKYLDSLNPETVVFEVCPYVFSLDGVESSLEMVSNDPIGVETMKMAFKQNHLKVYNALLFSLYRQLLFGDLENTVENVKKKRDTYIPGGFVEIELFHYEKESFQKQAWTKNESQLKAFNRIIEKLANRNIHLILVQAPVTSDLYDSYTNNEEFDREMIETGDYYNFNETLTLNDSLHFFDFHHLNTYGIEIFNQDIIDILDEKASK